MNRRLLALAAVVVAAATLAIPAVSVADDGGTGATPTTAKAGGHRAGAALRRVERRLDRRFKVFSKRCLVQNAPEACATAAGRFATHLGKLQERLGKLKAKIAETCGAAGAPARCSKADAATARIDALLAKVASDLAAIKAAYPGAGS